MIRRVRRSLQRGQSLTELALLLPILIGFVALTLQGGLVISDQVNLQHYAYEGATWGTNNRTTASTGTIRQHIYDQFCGSGNAVGSPSGITRYCRDGGLTVTVGLANATADRGPSLPSRLGLVNDALAAGCKTWDLSVSPNPTSIAQGGSQTFTITVTTSGSGTTPVVNLALGGQIPPYESNGTPLFNPPTIAASGGTSKLTIAPSINTPTTSYNVLFTGQDQCGAGPSSNGVTVPVTVTNGGGPGTITLPINLHIDGLFPLCVPVGTPATVTLHGANFAAGATVTFGSGSSSFTGTASVSNSTTMVVTIPSPPTTGVFDTSVTNPDGSTITLANALTVASSCTTPSPSNAPQLSGASTPCAAGGAGLGGQEYDVTVTWTENLVIPWLTSNLLLTAKQRAFCQ